MKEIVSFIALLILVSSCGESMAQVYSDKEYYPLDSLQIYNPKIDTFTFYLEGGKQGLFMEKFECNTPPTFYLKIVNNTHQNVSVSYRPQDGHLIWLPQDEYAAPLAPDGSILLKSHWGEMPDYNLGLFSSLISIRYRYDQQFFESEFRTWGMFTLPRQRHPEINLPYGVKLMDRTPLYKKTYPPIIGRKKDWYYKGEQVNAYTRKQLKTGKWVYLNADNSIASIEYYSGKKSEWDSVYFMNKNYDLFSKKIIGIKRSDTSVQFKTYNNTGELFKIVLWNGNEIYPPYYTAKYPNGTKRIENYPYPNKRRLEYYPTGSIHKNVSYNYDGKIDTTYEYQANGNLKMLEINNPRELPRMRKIYNEKGDLLSIEDIRWRNKIEYDLVYKNDTLIERKRSFNGKYIFTESGVFKNEILWNGVKKDIINQTRKQQIVYKNGVENGEIYNENWINKIDSLGKQGKWITFYRSDSIRSISDFQNGLTDSIVTYFESGQIQELRYQKGPYNNVQKIYTYYPNGFILKDEYGFKSDTAYVTYYPSKRKKEWKSSHGSTYRYNDNNDTCTYTRIFFQSTSRNQMEILYGYEPFLGFEGYSETEEYFENCKLVKRISPRYTYYSGIEGTESRLAPITVEVGVFKNGILYNGKKIYYANYTFLEREQSNNVEQIIQGQKK